MQRKSAIIILAAICLFCCFAVTAHAHPGRTDSQGGHYDQGTGEYHYHHGYPVHDHYDMDGDGTLDCPYNFEDKTGDNSAVISDNNSGYETYTYPMPEDIGGNGGDRKPSSTQAFSEKGAVKMEIWKVCILVLAFLGIIAIMCFIIRNQIRDKKRQKVQYEEKFKRERAKFCEELGKINDEMIRKKGTNYLYYLCDAPQGEYIGSDDLPTSQFTYNFKWGEKYTFYLGGNATHNSKYHRSTCRYANRLFPINAFSIKRSCNRYAPCAVCCPSLPDMEWVERYLRFKNILETYNVSVSQELPVIDINKRPNLGETTKEC